MITSNSFHPRSQSLSMALRRAPRSHRLVWLAIMAVSPMLAAANTPAPASANESVKSDTTATISLDTLMQCAQSQTPLTVHVCLPVELRDTAALADIERIWSQANPAQQAALAMWAGKGKEGEDFFIRQLPGLDSGVQYTVLTQTLSNEHGTAARIRGAMIVLQQVLDDPNRRPPRSDLAYTLDANDMLVVLEPDATAFPPVLEEAFVELVTYPDAHALMLGLSKLDHPYLATYASVWLYDHGHDSEAFHGMRFAIDANGIPDLWVLDRLSEDRIAADHALIQRILEHGSDAALITLGPEKLVGALDDPAIRALAINRVIATPAAIRALGIDVDVDIPTGVAARNSGFVHAMRASGVLVAALGDEREDIAAIAEAYSTQPEILWAVSAMMVWEELRDPRSQDIARRVLQHDDEKIRFTAAMILNTSRTEPLAGNGQWKEAPAGVLADAGSNRQWTRDDNGEEVEWPEALMYCINQPLAGGNWRLPTLAEFQLIHSPEREELTPCGISLGEQVNCRVPTQFKLTHRVFWLAASPDDEMPQGIDLTHGVANLTFANRALCVRDVPAIN